MPNLPRALRALWLRVRGMFRSGRVGGDFATEVESHLAMDIEDGVRTGLSREEARRQALIRLGGLEQAKIAQRERRGLPVVEALGRDIAYGVRTLRKNPGFAIVSILVIAIGIGANAALFTVVRSVLLRPLPFADPDRIVMMYGHNQRMILTRATWSRPAIFTSGRRRRRDLRRWPSGDGRAITFGRKERATRDGGVLRTVRGISLRRSACSRCSGGRLLRRMTGSGANRTVILNWDLFKRRFNADPAIIGERHQA